MLYVVYKILKEEPNKGYYWGKFSDPIKLAYACFNMAANRFYDIKIVCVEADSHIPNIVEW